MSTTRGALGSVLVAIMATAGCGQEMVQYTPSALAYTVDMSTDPSLQGKAIFRITETQSNGICAPVRGVNQLGVTFVTGTHNDVSHLREWQDNASTPQAPAAFDSGPLLAGLDGNVYFQVVRSLPEFHYAFYPVGTHSLSSPQDAKVGANAQVRLASNVVVHGAATLFALGLPDRTCSVVLSAETLPTPVSSPALYTAIATPSPQPSTAIPSPASSTSPSPTTSSPSPH